MMPNPDQHPHLQPQPPIPNPDQKSVPTQSPQNPRLQAAATALLQSLKNCSALDRLRKAVESRLPTTPERIRSEQIQSGVEAFIHAQPSASKHPSARKALFDRARPAVLTPAFDASVHADVTAAVDPELVRGIFFNEVLALKQNKERRKENDETVSRAGAKSRRQQENGVAGAQILLQKLIANTSGNRRGDADNAEVRGGAEKGRIYRRGSVAGKDACRTPVRRTDDVDKPKVLVRKAAENGEPEKQNIATEPREKKSVSNDTANANNVKEELSQPPAHDVKSSAQLERNKNKAGSLSLEDKHMSQCFGNASPTEVSNADIAKKAMHCTVANHLEKTTRSGENEAELPNTEAANKQIDGDLTRTRNASSTITSTLPQIGEEGPRKTSPSPEPAKTEAGRSSPDHTIMLDEAAEEPSPVSNFKPQNAQETNANVVANGMKETSGTKLLHPDKMRGHPLLASEQKRTKSPDRTLPEGPSGIHDTRNSSIQERADAEITGNDALEAANSSSDLETAKKVGLDAPEAPNATSQCKEQRAFGLDNVQEASDAADAKTASRLRILSNQQAVLPSGVKRSTIDADDTATDSKKDDIEIVKEPAHSVRPVRNAETEEKPMTLRNTEVEESISRRLDPAEDKGSGGKGDIPRDSEMRISAEDPDPVMEDRKEKERKREKRKKKRERRERKERKRAKKRKRTQEASHTNSPDGRRQASELASEPVAKNSCDRQENDGLCIPEDYGEQQKVLQAIKKLLKEEICEPFAEPVDATEEGCISYYQIIQHPMDFGTISKRLEKSSPDKSFYRNAAQVLEDFELIWSNCRKFNGELDPVCYLARECKIRLGILLEEFNVSGAVITKGRKSRGRSFKRRYEEEEVQQETQKRRKKNTAGDDRPNDGRLVGKSVVVFATSSGGVKSWKHAEVTAFDESLASYTLKWADGSKLDSSATFGINMKYPVFKIR